MQNDLGEFFAVADFVNPGLLGTLKSFRSRSLSRCTSEARGSCIETLLKLPRNAGKTSLGVARCLDPRFSCEE